MIEDKVRQNVTVQILYGKKRLQREEAEWLVTIAAIKCNFLKNLHAKCYLTEEAGIITSMNLYDFSQANNLEMGVIFVKKDDAKLYEHAYREFEQLSRISEEVDLSDLTKTDSQQSVSNRDNIQSDRIRMISTSKLSKQLGFATREMFNRLRDLGLITHNGGSWDLTESGIAHGGSMRKSRRGDYIVWPESIDLPD